MVTAGTHKVSSIRVAEAAKVIENIQRDVNIALVNELAMLFKDLGLDTREVLAAAGTKWNFHAYRPGLVGGHCIGVDPYYLTHKAQSIGFHPEMILAGRRINDGMAGFVARDIIKAMLHRKLKMDDAKVLVMGFTFKENIPDTRNTKVADLVRELGSFLHVVVFDPVADREDALHEYGISIVDELPEERFQAVVLAVKHREIMALGRVGSRACSPPVGSSTTSPARARPAKATPGFEALRRSGPLLDKGRQTYAMIKDAILRRPLRIVAKTFGVQQWSWDGGTGQDGAVAPGHHQHPSPGNGGGRMRHTIATRRFRPVAMSVLASGAISPREAIEYVCRQPAIKSSSSVPRAGDQADKALMDELTLGSGARAASDGGTIGQARFARGLPAGNSRLSRLRLRDGRQNFAGWRTGPQGRRTHA